MIFLAIRGPTNQLETCKKQCIEQGNDKSVVPQQFYRTLFLKVKMRYVPKCKSTKNIEKVCF